MNKEEEKCLNIKKKLFLKVLCLLCIIIMLPNCRFTSVNAENKNNKESMNIFDMQKSIWNEEDLGTGVLIYKQSKYSSQEIYEKAKAASKNYKKGREHHFKTIPSSNVKSVILESGLCGLALEPTEGKNFEVAFWGDDQEEASFTWNIDANGSLKMEAKGKPTDCRYVNIEKDKRFNVYVIKVPQKKYSSFTLNGGVGVAELSDLKTPLKVNSEGGSVGMIADKLTSAYSVKNNQGWSYVKADIITAPITMDVNQGWIDIEAHEITGKQTLTTNQGWIDVKTRQLGAAEMKSYQGWVNVTASSITKNVTIAAEQGWVDLVIEKNPKNMTIDLFKYPFKPAIEVPSNWKKVSKNRYQIGNGTPVISVIGNWLTVTVCDK